MPASVPVRFYPVASAQSYCPAGFTANARQKGTYYRGLGRRHPRGRPVLIHCDMQGWSTSGRAAYFDALGSDLVGTALSKDGLPYLALQNGWDVFSISISLTNQVDSAGAIISGKGLFRKPGDTDGGSVDLFSTKSFPEKDVMWANQYLIDNAATLGCNPGLTVFKGASAGASAGGWATFSRNYAGESGFSSGGTTRPTAGILLIEQTLYPLIGSTQSAVFTNHFPRETGVASTDWQIVAASYTGAAGFDASNNGTNWDRVETASLVRVAWDPTLSGAAGINEINAQVPLYLYGSSPVPTSAPFTTDPVMSDTPAATNWLAANYTPMYGSLDISGEDPFHNVYHSYLFKEIALANGMTWAAAGPVSRLVVPAAAAPTALWGSGKPRADLVLPGVDNSAYGPHAIDQMAWLRALEERFA